MKKKSKSNDEAIFGRKIEFNKKGHRPYKRGNKYRKNYEDNDDTGFNKPPK